MKRLKLQFSLFFFLLAGILALLLFNSYRQMAIEERAIWEGTSERVYNQMQAAISDFLTQEDERSFSEYRYYQALPGMNAPDAALSLSPLATLPKADTKGLLGYFQIDPDGGFSTPYLPAEASAPALEDAAARRTRENELKSLTQSLKTEVFVFAQGMSKGEAEKPAFGYGSVPDMSFPRDLKDGPIEVGGADAKNIYPNPVQAQKSSIPKLKKDSYFKDKIAAERDEEAEPKLVRRQLSPSAVQSRAFEEQRTAPTEFPRAEGGALTSFGAVPSASSGRVRAAEPPSLLVDPFQARLVEDKYLIFYRKLWLNQKLYLQGFAVEAQKFFTWAMEQSFLNSDLVSFAKAELDFGNRAVAGFDPTNLAGATSRLLFKRALGYPLHRFDLKVLAGELPRFSARSYLNIFTVVLIALVTGGLYLIYRSAAAQVHLSQKRQDFVSAVTHELKTPLTSIRMYSEMLEDGWVKEDAKRQEYYRYLSKESSRLSGLIDNVLQLARLEKQTYKLQMKRAVPQEDFDEWVRDLTKLAEARGFRLNSQRDADLPAVEYDAEALKQVLLILLDNSLKFAADSEKTLELSLTKEGDAAVLSWADHGPGIPKAELNKVFDKFYRVENELTRKTQGTGIGLAMAKIIVESMGAKIEARNRDGGGLLVRVIFTA